MKRLVQPSYSFSRPSVPTALSVARAVLAPTTHTLLPSSKNNLLLDVDIYAGWNTSSNTIGTTLGAATAYFFGKDEKSKIRFLIYRYYEDYGYMVYARKWVSEEVLPTYHLDPFDLENKNDIISKYVKDEINKVMKNDLGELTKYVDEIKVKMPWNRMFECDLDIIFKK